ncbi:derlin-1-like [Impatiens glandulifera]|uniref:derlin-1-like n=1 Tax=Impatiens glandulifera TaxID=253017 RepID=UPI001FB0861A|nr:derlin-1-like [Impatiens glandulifera]
MSSPMQYYNDLPPVSKTYVLTCFVLSATYEVGLYDYEIIALSYKDVIKRFQVWRLITNFFFLAPFSLTFAFRVLLVLRHGVQLEKSTYDKRSADFLWMFIFGAFSLLAISIIPFLWSPFMGGSLVFMIVYNWSREFPNARVNIYGLFELKGFYLPWYMIAIDLILGSPLKPDLIGMAAGHLYYFLTVLYPLSTGRNILKTPFWVHKLVAYWGKGTQMNSPAASSSRTSSAFKGRGRRLDGGRSMGSPEEDQDGVAQPNQANNNNGVVFRGQGHRLGAGGGTR